MSLRFNGTSDYFATPANLTTLDGLTAFTLMGWLRRTGPTASFATAISRQVGTGSGETLWLGTNSTQFASFISTTGGTLNLAGGTVTNGLWTHAAVTWTSGIARLYVFGAVVATATGGSASLSATTRELILGGNNNGIPLAPGEFWIGYLEDLRIYNRVLGEGEINTIFVGGGRDGIVQGLLARYSMTEGPFSTSPLIVPDYTGGPLQMTTKGGAGASFMENITSSRSRRPIRAAGALIPR